MHPLGREVEDEDLVRGASLGDRAAFGELYNRYARMVHGILLTTVPPWETEDLLQDIFLTALRRLSSLQNPAAFGGWLATIARNRAVDFHRSTRHRPQPLDTAPPHHPSQQTQHDAHLVLAAIRKLPLAYRETLILRLVEGMTGPEIAAQTGLSPDSVRVNLFRGMKMLRERLQGAIAK